MKASAFIFVILLLPLLLLPQSHGIRLGKPLTFVEEEEAHQQMDQMETRNWNNGDAEADIDHGREGIHYSCENTQCEGKNRKLLTSSSSKGHAKKTEFSATSSTAEFEGYDHDIIDIAGMDYSPAKRKPPIHN